MEIKTPVREVNKNLVRQRFKRSLTTYRKNAFVQQGMTLKLIDHLLATKEIDYSNVLEIGMGTGFLTEQLIDKCVVNKLYANDLVEDCERTYVEICNKFNQTNAKFLSGDIENIRLPEKITLAISSSTFQWLSNIELFLSKLNRALSEGAHIAFTTFGESNLFEINEIVNFKLNYTSFEELNKLISRDFDILYKKREEEVIYFDSAIDILRHLKLTGVNALSQRRWTKRNIDEFETEYIKRFKTHKGLRLTYNPLYFIAKKKN